MAETMDRRRFIALAAGGAALGALVVLHGCSSGSDSPGTTPETPTAPETPTYTDMYGKVSSNHGHNFKLSASQQEAGVETRIYSYGATHSHKLALTEADIATVVAGTKWSAKCTVDAGHDHVVTFN